MAPARTLLYLVRRDLRVSDNPILHHLATATDHGFARLLPVYIFPAHQMELSGFMRDGKSVNPYPEARSKLGGYWRCGPHRAAFIAESVWDMKASLEDIGSGLCLRVGSFPDVVRGFIEALRDNGYPVGAVWMTGHEGTEERCDEKAIASLCEENGARFKLWTDEKYLIDDRDLGFQPSESPDVLLSYSAYLKHTEPLRQKPRSPLPAPEPGTVPSLPDHDAIPAQTTPFTIPESLEGLTRALVHPVELPNLPPYPVGVKTDRPRKGGERAARRLLEFVVLSGIAARFKGGDELIGSEYCTNLSSYLAQGCITSRQINLSLTLYESGQDSSFQKAVGYGAGENKGTSAMRRNLLWRDYFRLCHQRDGDKVFCQSGPDKAQPERKAEATSTRWKTPIQRLARPDQDPSPQRVADVLARFRAGATGMGLIDASQRELLHTGFTPNRARQNVANFLAKLMGIDWRYGAEWYEMLLVDYDVSTNWGNWQYIAGVGSDPRGTTRTFNPVKQAFTYDRKGGYVRMWMPELAKIQRLENLFQVSTTSREELAEIGLENSAMAADPVLRVVYDVDGKPRKARNHQCWKTKNKSISGQREDSPSGSGSTAAAPPDTSAGQDDGVSGPVSSEAAREPPWRGRGGPARRGASRSVSSSQSRGGSTRGGSSPFGGPPPTRGGLSRGSGRGGVYTTRGAAPRGNRARPLARGGSSPGTTPTSTARGTVFEFSPQASSFVPARSSAQGLSQGSASEDTTGGGSVVQSNASQGTTAASDTGSAGSSGQDSRRESAGDGPTDSTQTQPAPPPAGSFSDAAASGTLSTQGGSSAWEPRGRGRGNAGSGYRGAWGGLRGGRGDLAGPGPRGGPRGRGYVVLRGFRGRGGSGHNPLGVSAGGLPSGPDGNGGGASGQ